MENEIILRETLDVNRQQKFLAAKIGEELGGKIEDRYILHDELNDINLIERRISAKEPEPMQKVQIEFSGKVQKEVVSVNMSSVMTGYQFSKWQVAKMCQAMRLMKILGFWNLQ